MNISINNLINYFNKDEDINDNFVNLKKDETSILNNIHEFKNIFGDYLIRIASAVDSNISFLYSLLYLLDDEYYSFSLKEQKEYINALKKKLKNEITKKNFIKDIKLSKNGWNKKNILLLVNNNITNNNYIYYVSAFFNINIFLIDVNDKNIYIFYNEDEYSKYKTNICILKFNDHYEPIMYEDGSKHISSNSQILTNILNSERIKIPVVGFTKKIVTKDFKLTNDIDTNIVDSISNEDSVSTPVYKINDVDIQLELNTVSEEYNTENNLIENKYSTQTVDELVKKYKKPDLIKICKEIKIPYSGKNKLQLAKNIIEKSN